MSVPAALTLNPLDKKSIVSPAPDVSSAFDPFALKELTEALYGLRDVSCILHWLVAFEFFHIINLGLNPVYANGPSLEPLPVYEPNAEYPAICAKQ